MFKKISGILGESGDADSESESIGSIILGTPRGDIHNLGKDIFSAAASASGFIIHDLGVDVSPQAFVEKLEETGAPILGMSSLLTTTFQAIEEVMSMIEQRGIRNDVKVILGGGATTRDLVEKLGVDEQTVDAYEGIRMVKSFVEK
jgi:methylmalonyl-CoA mutase cobalamin-binding domain/chain